jgi:hypothetical protein
VGVRFPPRAPLTSPTTSGAVQESQVNFYFNGVSYPNRSEPVHSKPGDLTVYLTVSASCVYQRTVMPLTDKTTRNAKGREAPYKLFDGGGLHLLVRPDGARYWRMDYRFAGKRRTLALGIYPSITLAAAREQRDAAKRHLASGMRGASRKDYKSRLGPATHSELLLMNGWRNRSARVGPSPL